MERSFVEVHLAEFAGFAGFCMCYLWLQRGTSGLDVPPYHHFTEPQRQQAVVLDARMWAHATDATHTPLWLL
eukprot:1157975-Pelagomonas_calceolata.AAC.11